MNSVTRFSLSLLATGTMAVSLSAATAQSVKPARPDASPVLADGVIVKMKPSAMAKAMSAATVSAMSARAGAKLTARDQLASGAVVYRVSSLGAGNDARVVAARLREDPTVEYAVPNIIVHALAVAAPSDPRFSEQWPLRPAVEMLGGANVPSAWNITPGSNAIVVAVVDSGIRPGHPDLAGRLLPGYDFVSGDRGSIDGVPANWYSADGDGRDADPTDPGDYVTSTMISQLPSGYATAFNISARSSSWHGTHVAGTIGAAANNSAGIVGVDWNARILPVRVMGRTGTGSLADILAGIEWAAGFAVPGVPVNPNPAHVINLSLGGSGSCNAAYQDTINRVAVAGKIIVAATGNDAGPVGSPANCAGVIAVTAHAADGDNADYANVGPQVHVSAPGGGCGYRSVTNSEYAFGEQGWTVLNCASCHSLDSLRAQITARAPSGLTRSKALSALNAALSGTDLDATVTGMGTFAYLSTTQRAALADYIGNYPACLGPSDRVLSTVNTSSQGPAAEGYGWKQGTSMATPHVSGVVSLMLALSPRLTPNEVRSILQSTARPHPVNTTCFGITGQCGSGLLDAASAVARVRDNLPTVSVGSDQVVRPGTVVRLTATASGPRPLSYQWRQTSGPQVGLATPIALSASFPAAGSGTLGFEFVAYDAMGGYEARATTTVRVNSPPVMSPITPVSTTVGSTVTGRVSATDADGDRILYVATSLPSGMVLNPDSGEYTWTPTSAVDTTLIVVAADAMGNGAPATARVVAQAAGTPTGPSAPNSSAVAPSGGGGGAPSPMIVAVLAALALLASASRKWGARRSGVVRSAD